MPRIQRSFGWLKTAAVWIIAGCALLAIVGAIAVNTASLPVVRALVVRQANAALEGVFQGKLRIVSVAAISLRGASGIDAKMFDPAGREVISVRGASAELDLGALIWSLWARPSGPIRIDIRNANINQVELRVIDDGSGWPTVLNALRLAPSNTPSAPGVESRSPSLALDIRPARVSHAWIHGRLLPSMTFDEDIQVVDSAIKYSAGLLTVTLGRSTLVARSLAYANSASGQVAGSIALPIGTMAPLVHVSFRGQVADSATDATVDWTDGALKASLVMPRCEPQTVSRLVPGWRSRQALALRVNVQGPPTHVNFDVEGTLLPPDPWKAAWALPATLHAMGYANFVAGISLALEFQVNNIDLASLFPEAKSSHLDGAGRFAITRTRDGHLAGSYSALSPPWEYASYALPGYALSGSFQGESFDFGSTKGTARLFESGADTTLQFVAQTRPNGSESMVSGHALTELYEPKRLEHMAQGLRARGTVNTNFRYTFADGLWSALAHARLHDVSLQKLSAARVEATLEVAGKHSVPHGSLHLDAEGITAWGQAFRAIKLSSEGDLEHAQLTAQILRENHEVIDLSTEVRMLPNPFAAHATLVVASRVGTAVVAVESAHLIDGQLRVQGLHVEGVGNADASFAFGKELDELSLTTSSLQIGELAQILGLTLPFRAGSTTLVATFSKDGRDPKGEVSGRVTGLAYKDVSSDSIEAHLTLEQGLIDGTVLAGLSPGSQVRLSIRELSLRDFAEPRLGFASPNYILSAQGSLDLASLGPWVTKDILPFDNVAGRVDVDVSAQGPHLGSPSASLSMHLKTQSLELNAIPPNATPGAKPPSTERPTFIPISGIDAEVELELAGAKSPAVARIRLFDKRGTLVDAQVRAELPNRAWPDLALTLEELGRIPIQAKLQVPVRRLGQLPSAFGLGPVRGKATLSAELTGTLAAPAIVIDGSVKGLAPIAERIVGTKISKLDLTLHAEATRQSGRLKLQANVSNRIVGKLESQWIGDLFALRGLRANGRMPLRSALVVELDQFPIEAIPSYSAEPLSGAISGSLRIAEWGQDAALSCSLKGETLQSGGVAVERATVEMIVAKGEAKASISVNGRASGLLRGDIRTRTTWGDNVAPTFDSAVSGNLSATGFQLAVLAPLLGEATDELTGNVDASLKAKWAEGRLQLNGAATIRDGSVQIPKLGQRFESIRAKLTLQDQQLRIDDFEARGITGRLTGNAEGTLDGGALQTGRAHVSIDRGNQLPVTLEGQTLGNVWGRIDATLDRSKSTETTKIQLALPELHFELPDVDPSELQELDAAKHVRIGVRQRDGRYVAGHVRGDSPGPAERGETFLIEANLGKEVWLEKGKGIKVQLGGKVTAKISDTTTILGRIALRGGTLEVSGKQFEIESGVVVFSEAEPNNPTISATARWDSPDEYRVFAQYTGTLKDGKLKLRAEPPLSADRIVSLLLFGTADGTLGDTGTVDKVGNSTATAMGAAGGIAVKGLNKAISSITKLDVSARLDTSTGAARPELDVQLARRVTARMSRAIGDPAFGQSPDRTFLTFEFQLRRSWSLSAVVGDRGASALELLWRRRY